MDNTVRHRVTTGKFTLPSALLLSVIVWSMTSLGTWQSWACFACLAVITLVLRIVYNNVSLIRIRSWFLSSLFIVLCSAIPFTHTFDLSLLSLALFLVAQHFLFASYQEPRAERYIFHAFIFLFLASVFMPQMIVFALVFFIAMIVQLRAFTLRSFIAIFLALIVIAQLLALGYTAIGHYDIIVEHFRTLGDFRYEQAMLWNKRQCVNFGFVAIFLLLSLIHYGRTNFNDKIRTRMFFYVIIMETVTCMGLLIIYPQHFNILFRWLLLLSAPLLAHYFVLARGKIMDYFFLVFIAMVICLIVYNTWI